MLSDELTFEQVPLLREDPSSEETKIKNLKNPVAGTKTVGYFAEELRVSDEPLR